MNKFYCPHCRESYFATLCSDCLAEEIHILRTKSALHVGQCHRCGHVDAEPCSGYASSSNNVLSHAHRNKRIAFKSLYQFIASVATRATGAIRSDNARQRQS